MLELHGIHGIKDCRLRGKDCRLRGFLISQGYILLRRKCVGVRPWGGALTRGFKSPQAGSLGGKRPPRSGFWLRVSVLLSPPAAARPAARGGYNAGSNPAALSSSTAVRAGPRPSRWRSVNSVVTRMSRVAAGGSLRRVCGGSGLHVVTGQWGLIPPEMGSPPLETFGPP